MARGPALGSGRNLSTDGDFSYDPLALLRRLHENGVKFIVIGGVAARVHGSPSVTVDLDICYERSRTNLEALAQVLRSLNAQLRGADPGLPFEVDWRALQMGDHFTLTTDLGDVDCLGAPAGTSGYPDLVRNATELEIEGLPIKFAGLDDLIQMKRAAGRPKDRIELEILGALKDELDSSDH